MPRKPRIISSTGIYHVILRAVNQQVIFEENQDYQKFLFMLSDCREKYGLTIYAYCLMSNHIHLLLHCPDGRISEAFRSLGTRFVRWYNQKYDRFGHLFQERFISHPVEKEDYFLNTLLYIHENPVKAGVCRYGQEYPWSSCRAYFGTKNDLVDIEFAAGMMGSHRALHHYFSINSDNDDVFYAYDLTEPMLRHKYQNDEVAESQFKAITGLSSPSDVQKLSIIDRNRVIRLLLQSGMNHKQISRLCGLAAKTVARIDRNYRE